MTDIAPIPARALDDRVAIVGTAGAGKTYAAKSAVERLVRSGSRTCVVDPLGVWWGLRHGADGKAPGLDVVIFGGLHADIPIAEASAAPLAKAIAEGDFSCVVDLSELGSGAARRRFMSTLAEGLYTHNRDPLHMILDEADMWAPQRPLPDQTVLLNRIDEIVRRGRVRGFIPWLITQRPAVVHKDVLSQADILIAMKLTSSQDRDAIGAWIEGQADRADGKRILADLPKLPRGEGYVWAPGHGILKRSVFPTISTFDSSRTPKRGEKKAKAPSAHGINDTMRATLMEALEVAEQEIAESDPKALRKEIADLRHRLVIAQERVEPDPRALEEARARGEEAGARATLSTLVVDVAKVKLAAIEARNAIDGLVNYSNSMLAMMERVVGANPKAIEFPNVTTPEAARNRARLLVKKEVTYGPQPADSAALETRDMGIQPRRGAEKRILKVLAQRHPAWLTMAQWATLCGMKRTGGTWATYVSRLRSANFIQTTAGKTVTVTPAGMREAGVIAAQPNKPEEILEMWCAALGGGAARMLRRIVQVAPGAISIERLAADLEMSARGGTFATYMSRLRSNDLVTKDRDGLLRASPLLHAQR